MSLPPCRNIQLSPVSCCVLFSASLPAFQGPAQPVPGRSQTELSLLLGSFPHRPIRPIHPWALLRSFLGLLYPPKSLRRSSCPPSPRSLALPVWSSLIPLSSWAPTAPTVWVIEARAALCYFPLISSMLTHSLQLHQKVKNQSLAFSQNPEHWRKANNLENSVLLVDWNNDWPGLHQSTEGLAEMFPQAYWGPILEDTVGIFHIWVHTFTRS